MPKEKVVELGRLQRLGYDVVNINGDCWFSVISEDESYSNGEPIPMIFLMVTGKMVFTECIVLQ